MSATMRKPPLDHPWRGLFAVPVERPVEEARTCSKCGRTQPLREFRPLKGGRYRGRECYGCIRLRTRRAARVRQERGEPYRHSRESRERENAARRRQAVNARLARGLVPAPRHWWTVPQAAAEIGISTNKVYRLLRAGILTAGRDTDGKRWRVRPPTRTEVAA